MKPLRTLAASRSALSWSATHAVPLANAANASADPQHGKDHSSFGAPLVEKVFEKILNLLTLC